MKDHNLCFLVWEENKFYVNPEHIEQFDKTYYLNVPDLGRVLLPHLLYDDLGYFVRVESFLTPPTSDFSTLGSFPFAYFGDQQELWNLYCNTFMEASATGDNEGNGSVRGGVVYQNEDRNLTIKTEGEISRKDGKTSAEATVSITLGSK